MQQINLSEFGTSLRIRKSAKMIRESLNRTGKIIFDFQSIRLMSPSFCDELFGILFYETGEDFFRAQLQFKNISEDLKAILKRSIQSRKEMKEGASK